MTETLLFAASLILPLVCAIVVHEVAHGWIASLLGDPTAREQRRLSLNPIRHVDPVGTVILPGMLALSGAPVFGWAKPVPVDARRLRNPRVHMMLVAFAGPASNLLLALLAVLSMALMIAVAGTGPDGFGPIAGFLFLNLSNFLLINVFLALFNLLPIPPFDGSHIVEGLLPRPAARAYNRLRPFGLVLLLVLLVALPLLAPQLGIVERIVVPPVEWTVQAYLSLVGLDG